jgi:hypothetical protein
MLQFRIWHLLALTAVVAIAITVADLLSYRTVTVEFAYSPIIQPLPSIHLPTSPEEFLVPLAAEAPTTYYLSFQTLAEAEPKGGMLVGRFGPNTLLEQEITPDNLSSLDGRTVTIRHRYRSLPWAPATTIEDEIAQHFDELLPQVEWQRGPANAWMARVESP